MNEKEITSKEGWNFPLGASSFHYFRPGCVASVCGKWMFHGHLSQDLTSGAPYCRPCYKTLNALRGIDGIQRHRNLLQYTFPIATSEDQPRDEDGENPWGPGESPPL